METKAEGGERKAEGGTRRPAVAVAERGDIVSQAALVVTELPGRKLVFQSFGNGEAEKILDEIVHMTAALFANADGWAATVHDGEPEPATEQGNSEQKATKETKTAEEVFALNARQHEHPDVFQRRHPYTCGNDSGHRPLIATPYGWRCADCDYTQSY